MFHLALNLARQWQFTEPMDGMDELELGVLELFTEALVCPASTLPNFAVVAGAGQRRGCGHTQQLSQL